ncbi:MAG TPA: NAD(P)-binding domain-containing protein [Solirubrobacteraceae bacterium]|jgi:dimethylaniline monooxygenase (N-oxide forming)|nr:NAD(P)-binding domain-containing protein [Solirubrobacteraceae bacterium]
MALPRACIVGAGSSGIAAAKALADRGIPFDCFEKSDRVGGNWVLGNRNGMSSAYSTLHINTSRERMEYADFPMPASYPDFPRHDQIARYFSDYVDHFGLRERIAFETGVEHAARREDGVWEVTLEGGERRRYDALLVANGHHWDPRWPEPPLAGSFDGELIHSHEYRDPSQLEGKRVVVVGMGNSAMDIAVDASYHAAATTLIARTGVHVVPKYILGQPLDAGVRPSRIPFQWLLAGMQLVLRLTVGPMERYGLPNPEHRLGRAHPTVSTRILDRLAHGEIEVKRGIARLEGGEVLYTDGTRAAADLIVCCTGYKISFPFFDERFFAAPENRLELYKRMFDPAHPGLYLIGFVQPWGAIMPIAELQGRLVGDHLLGEYALPAPEAMRSDVARMLRRQQRRYLASKRHTLQVDFANYAVELEDERRAGARRAQERGFAPAIAAQAQRAATPVLD